MIFENENTYNKTNDRRKGIAKPTHYSGLGKLPPQAIDLEEAILGALMLQKIEHTIFSSLRPEYFYKDNHQKIYQAITILKQDKKPIDILTVTSQLRKQGELEIIGGAYYITELTNRVASASNIEFHIAVIHEKFLSREMIRIGTTAINNCYDDTSSPFEEMANVFNEMDALKKGLFKRTEKRIDRLIFDMNEDRYRERTNGLIGSSTGFAGIDYITQGDQEGQLIIDAGRPGSGKSAKMCAQIKINAFDLKIPVACFSLEMSSVQLTYRILANISEVDTNKIKKNSLNQTESLRIDEYCEKLSEAEIYIDDTPGLTIDEFETKATLLVAKYGVKKIFIDYLQLMKGEKGKKYGNRETEISDISRRLKIISKELGITIIALCQLSRAVEGRKFCIPVLSDLRESGSLEQDADVVNLIWRPEQYPEVLTELSKPEGSINISIFNFKITEYSGLMINIVAKCREEETGKVPLRFNGKIMRVKDHPLVLDAIESKKSIFNPFQTHEKDAF